MRIISHRGYWKTAVEKNAEAAFDRSFALGFGTETDLRDANGRLVISHDMPEEKAMSASHFFEKRTGYNGSLPLALNIKADGLQKPLKVLLQAFNITDYFVFDMSVPDTINYIEEGITFFSRQSEYEQQPVFYKECTGIWLDAFHTAWYDENLIRQHLGNQKQVAIVSPELHRRAHLQLWEDLKAWNLHIHTELILCTDMPEDARNFFKP